jgi:hypothetical protein
MTVAAASSAVARRRVIHVSPRVTSRGGIETLHNYHRTLSGENRFVALFDRGTIQQPGDVSLEVSWRTPLWLMRRRFARAMAVCPSALVCYHNGWGMPLLHDLDRSVRRLVMLHAEPAYHAADMPSFHGLVDGYLLASPKGEAAVSEAVSGWDAQRTVTLKLPLEPIAAPPRPEFSRDRPLVLGYAGRVERVQKRIDLLPAFLREIEAAGVCVRFEITGAGTWLYRLKEQVGSNVVFHGWLDGSDYRRVVGSWDAAVYFSEHEAGPIALLEAMSAGVIPFYPRVGGSWADEYSPRVDELCHYPPGDMNALASAVRAVFRSKGERVATLRERAISLVEGHRIETYKDTVSDFFSQISSLPRVSCQRARHPRLTDCLPLGLITRILPYALRRS